MSHPETLEPAATGHEDDPSVAALIVRVAAGEPAALELLYQRTSARVFATAKAILPDPAQAEEATQEVYLQLWLNAAARFDPRRGSANSYLNTLARRRAVDEIRKTEVHRRHDAIPGPSRADLDLAEAAVARLQLDNALGRLGEQAHRILTLYYYLDHDHTQISALLAIPVGTVKSQHHRALAALRREFLRSPY